MNWKNLSVEAKSIVEWVENPYIERGEIIKIKVGEVFHRERTDGRPNVDILVTKELYQEVLQYVLENKEIQCEYFSDVLFFKPRGENKLKWLGTPNSDTRERIKQMMNDTEIVD